MCPTDSIPDPKHPTRRPRSGGSVVVLRPTEVLDPYSERVTSLGGVRQHTAPTATNARKSTTGFVRSRRRHPFGASILITFAAQGVLAASIATQQLSPLLGAAAAIGLMTCGLALIAAEALQAVSR